MFDNIKTRKTKPETLAPEVSQEELYIMLLESAGCDRSDLNEATAIFNSIVDLRALKASLEKYGLTESILSFADHNGVLSKSVKGIPSLEAFVRRPTKFTKEDAIQGLDAAIEVSLDTLRYKIGQHMGKYRTFYVLVATVAGIANGYGWLFPLLASSLVTKIIQSLGGTELPVEMFNNLAPDIDKLVKQINESTDKLKAAKLGSFTKVPELTRTNALHILDACSHVADEAKGCLKKIDPKKIQTEFTNDSEKDAISDIKTADDALHEIKQIFSNCRSLAREIRRIAVSSN